MKKIKVTEASFRRFECYALITGAAGGMGRLYAAELAGLGFNLILVDINGESLALAEQELRAEVASFDDFRSRYKDGFKVIPITQDLSQMDAADRVKAIADDAGAQVEMLVNNAGILYATGIVDTSDRRLQLMTMLHCMTPLMLCKKFVPAMRERGHGYVLNVSSLGAWMPWPCLGMYSSTKGFIKTFSRAMRIELRGTGVTVTNAYFGAVDTPLIPLAPNLKKLAHVLGVMIYPQKAVYCALKATLAGRRGTMPGFINHLAKVFCPMFGERFLGWVYRKYGHYFANF